MDEARVQAIRRLSSGPTDMAGLLRLCEHVPDLLDALEAAQAEVLRLTEALDIVRRCAHDRYDEMGGDCPTYELAFAAAEIGAAALHFIHDHANSALEAHSE